MITRRSLYSLLILDWTGALKDWGGLLNCKAAAVIVWEVMLMCGN